MTCFLSYMLRKKTAREICLCIVGRFIVVGLPAAPDAEGPSEGASCQRPSGRRHFLYSTHINHIYRWKSSDEFHFYSLYPLPPWKETYCIKLKWWHHESDVSFHMFIFSPFTCDDDENISKESIVSSIIPTGSVHGFYTTVLSNFERVWWIYI